jgi:tRNA threonylcarbamoyladenosine biosynthesis protein TsaB
MTVLGFDTSTSATAVALRLGDGRTSEARDDPPTGAHPGHATRLLALAQELLDAAGVGWEELGRIAVGVGPGTFTGLRVGVSTARGLSQSLGAELVGVGSLDALALPVLESEPELPVLALIDARRGEVFAGAFERGTGSKPSTLAPPQPLAPGALATITGTDASGWIAVGDGALRYRADVEAAGARVPPDGDPLHRVTAAAVCELGASAPVGDPAAIVPDYRRRPDAELALERTAASGGA